MGLLCRLSSWSPNSWAAQIGQKTATSRAGPEPDPHIEVTRPGELVGIDCFFVGRLTGTKGAVWQLTAIDVASSFAWAELVSCPRGNPTGAQTSKLARRVCADLAAAG